MKKHESQVIFWWFTESVPQVTKEQQLSLTMYEVVEAFIIFVVGALQADQSHLCTPRATAAAV